jgi:hypothetical protein
MQRCGRIGDGEMVTTFEKCCQFFFRGWRDADGDGVSNAVPVEADYAECEAAMRASTCDPRSRERQMLEYRCTPVGLRAQAYARELDRARQDAGSTKTGRSAKKPPRDPALEP